MHACSVHVQLFAAPWTVAHQALLSMGFSREEYWCGLPCPPPGDLPDPEIKLASPASSCIGRQILCQNHLGRHTLFDFQFLDHESSVNVSLLPITLHMVSIQLRFLHFRMTLCYQQCLHTSCWLETSRNCWVRLETEKEKYTIEELLSFLSKSEEDSLVLLFHL